MSFNGTAKHVELAPSRTVGATKTYAAVKLFDMSKHDAAEHALDSGEAASIEDAMALFARYSLHIHAGDSVGASAAQQAALLTAVNAARRAFLGGVTVSGLAPDTPLLVPVMRAETLAAAVHDLGGTLSDDLRPAAATLAIGHGGPRPATGVRASARGWIASCAPVADNDQAEDGEAFVLAGVAAAALAVAECFQQVRGRTPAAGRRRIAISLWRPDLPDDADAALGNLPSLLPAAAWLIGLGNLGQAYLWCLGMLPYADPSALSLTLQDFDRIAPSNESTSLLTTSDLVGTHKTRAMARWAEARGFTTTIVERRFDRDLRVGADDPAVALCGVDNALARAALEETGFARVLEAGLGNGVSDFLALRLHSFPGPRSARAIWGAAAPPPAAALDMPAYRALEMGGADKCGLVQLAGRTVGAPFVGALAGALVVAELVKLANGGPTSALIDLHLRTPEHRTAVLQSEMFALNPGTAAVA